MPVRNYTPQKISSMLWGNRKLWGLTPNEDDRCWQEWQTTYASFYEENQREGIGTKVNDAGYSLLSSVALKNKSVLEIGAGDIRHSLFWKDKPKEYILADISEDMMSKAKVNLDKLSVRYTPLLISRNQPLPLEDSSVDIILSFYSLEHLFPLEPYLQEYHRILKPGGIIAGAIPTEGGLSWGAGRFLTSRRWFKKNTDINPDKIICWEHPNFADEILPALDRTFLRESIEYWPLKFLPIIDLNLVIKFKFRKI